MSPTLRDIIRNWDAKDIRNLILTVLALVIPIYFQKVVGFGADVVSELSSSLSTKFVDDLYQSASGNPIAMMSLLVFLILYTMPLMILIVNQASLKSNESIPHSSRSIISNYFSKKSNAFLICFLIFLIVVFILLFIATTLTVSIPLLAYVSFNQKISALTPYMTDQERNLIISKWAFMTTKKEYITIISDLNTIAAAHNLKLPSTF